MRSEPSQARSRETVRALLDSADAEFAEHGYEAAQVTRIAERAGVSVGSMYRYFPDLKSLMSALNHRYIDTVTERYAGLTTQIASPDHVPAALADAITAAVSLRFEHPGFYRVANELGTADHPWTCDSTRDGLVNEFATLLESIGIHPAPSAPPLRATLAQLANAARVMIAALDDRDPVDSPAVDEMVVMMLAYLRVRTEGVPSSPNR